MPPLSISPIEVVWIVTNILAITVCAHNLIGALQEKHAYEALSEGVERSAREVAATGNVRRELVRLIVQTLLLAVVLPSLFTDFPLVFVFDPFTSPETFVATLRSIAILSLIAAPFTLLYNSVADARDRRTLASFTLAELLSERQALDLRVKNALAELAKRADRQDNRMDAEMSRTDRHQGAQDVRIEDQGARLDDIEQS